MNNHTPVYSDRNVPTLEYGTRDGFFAPGGQRRNLMVAALLLLALALAIGFYFLSSGDQAAAPAGDDDNQLPVITVVAPGTATIEGVITAPGTIAARREIRVGVVGEGGRVVAVAVDAGDWVRAGQVLVAIDRSVQSQQAQGSAAQIQVARADANLAQSNLDRALQLVERGFISKADVDRLTATRDAAAARVRVAEAQLRELRARNARLNVVAPAGGLVLQRNVEPGQTVSSGSQPLFTIARGGEMELMAQVSEADLARLSTGVTAEVTPVGSDKTFSGQIWQLSPMIDQQNRQGTARIALPYSRELRPGGFATARISSGTLVAPMLPESAVLADDNGSYVYIIDADDKAQRRDVKTGLITGDGVAIAQGLDGSERVVLRAGGFLNPGESVKPRLSTDSGS